jgi:hypothetical protein
MLPKTHPNSRQCHNKFRGAAFLLLCAPRRSTIPALPCDASPGPPSRHSSPSACAAGRDPLSPGGSDLRADPAARFGTLPNGLRYVVMPNHEPKGRASLRLLVLAGSFEETEAQRGLAHFLEHMAFNGSTHYAPGTLVERLQRLGMGFGADTNASTSFDHTIYQLELPDTAPATLTEGLQILADYGGGLLLEQDGRQGARDHPEREAHPRLGRLPHAGRRARVHGGGHPRPRAAAHRAHRRDREVGP